MYRTQKWKLIIKTATFQVTEIAPNNESDLWSIDVCTRARWCSPASKERSFQFRRSLFSSDFFFSLVHSVLIVSGRLFNWSRWSPLTVLKTWRTIHVHVSLMRLVECIHFSKSHHTNHSIFVVHFCFIRFTLSLSLFLSLSASIISHKFNAFFIPPPNSVDFICVICSVLFNFSLPIIVVVVGSPSLFSEHLDWCGKCVFPCKTLLKVPFRNASICRLTLVSSFTSWEHIIFDGKKTNKNTDERKNLNKRKKERRTAGFFSQCSHFYEVLHK